MSTQDSGLGPLAPLSAGLAEVRTDREHGASWLARRAALALQTSAQQILTQADGSHMRTLAEQFWMDARALSTARPSMAAIATTVARICAAGWLAANNTAPDDRATSLFSSVRAEASRVAEQWERATAGIVESARKYVHGTVLTHSRSGTVEQVLTRLHQDGAVSDVVVTVSQPGGEGIALGETLATAGVPITVIADAAVGLVAPEVDCVVVGADSVRADGSVVNKVGTLLLALAARETGTPVFVVCEEFKVAPANWPLRLEALDPAQVLPHPRPGMRARNIVFDRTPADLITACLTEQGAWGRAQIAARADEAESALALLQQPLRWA